jgi:hypothetical protein
MNEALALAAWLCEHLNGYRVRDDGACYAILVTDTAGNVAEIEANPAGRWIWEEGHHEKRLRERLRMEEK